MRLSSSALALFMAGVVPSQTYVVDAAGGPGANFTSIAAAVAAVPDGSVLLVRAGTYGGFVANNKGLTVLADPGVAVQPPAPTSLQPMIVIQNTTATQAVVLRNLQLNGGGISCTYCAGPVLLDQIRGQSPGQIQGLLDVLGCTQVMATSSVFTSGPLTSAVTVRGSQFVLVDSTAGSGFSYGAGLWLQGSRVQVVSSVVYKWYQGAAIAADTSSDLRLLGSTTVTAPSGGSIDFAIQGYPTVRRASTVTLTGVVQATMVAVANESLFGTGGALGGSVSATLNGATGDLAVLCLGVTGPPLPLPGALSWWLDPAVSSSVALAVLSGPVTATVPIPPTPALQGEVFGFQGLYLTPTGLSVSNPYRFAIR